MRCAGTLPLATRQADLKYEVPLSVQAVTAGANNELFDTLNTSVKCEVTGRAGEDGSLAVATCTSA